MSEPGSEGEAAAMAAAASREGGEGQEGGGREEVLAVDPSFARVKVSVSRRQYVDGLRASCREAAHDGQIKLKDLFLYISSHGIGRVAINMGSYLNAFAIVLRVPTHLQNPLYCSEIGFACSL